MIKLSEVEDDHLDELVSEMRIEVEIELEMGKKKEIRVVEATLGEMGLGTLFLEPEDFIEAIKTKVPESAKQVYVDFPNPVSRLNDKTPLDFEYTENPDVFAAEYKSFQLKYIEDDPFGRRAVEFDSIVLPVKRANVDSLDEAIAWINEKALSLLGQSKTKIEQYKERVEEDIKNLGLEDQDE